MKNEENIQYRRKYLPIITSFLLLILMLSVSYAFFIYNSSGTKNISLESGELFLELNELSEGAVLTNQYPMTDEEGINQETSFNFSVSGYSVGTGIIYYDVFAIPGSSVSGKTLYDDNDISIYLIDDQGFILYGPSPATGFSTTGTELVTGEISGGDENNLIIHNYTLKVWLSDRVVISKTETSIEGKTVYTPEEMQGKYFSIKIKVKSNNTGEYNESLILAKVKYNLASNLYTAEGDTDQTFVVGTASDTSYNPNNYLWYSGKLWRIVALNKTDGEVTSVKIITQDGISSVHYNGSLADGGSGDIVYKESFMYQWLNEDFYSTLRNPTNFLVTDYSWNATQTSAVTKPANTTMVTATVGTLNIYEYVTSYVNTTAANAYLKNNYYWLLMNSYNSSDLYYVDYLGVYSHTNYSSSSYPIRPSVNLKPNIRIVAGTGTSTDPYRLEGDYDQEIDLIGNKINTRYSGEYVTFNNETYRIVQVENNLTKLVSTSYLKSSGTDVTKYFGTTNLYSQSLLDGTGYFGGYLNDTSTSGWYGSLSSNSQNMIETGTWYLGTVAGNVSSYKKSICATVSTIASGGTLTSACERTSIIATAKVGLLRVGEMFATQTETGGYSASSYSYLITPYSATNVYTTQKSGSFFNVSPTTSYRTKQSFYLKSDIIITAGDGMPNNPFIVSTPPTILEKINADLSTNLYTPSGDNDQTFIVGTASDTNYNPDNYLWYSGKMWRIVALNKTGGVVTSIKLITQDNITTMNWNGTIENGGSGGNIFQDSYIYQWLNEDFYDTLRNREEYVVSDYIWNSSSTTGNKPSNTIMVPGRVGLLNTYEYTVSAINTTTTNCYLKNGYSWWTITISSSPYVRNINETGENNYVKDALTNVLEVRPSINLKSSARVAKGNGTIDNPYRLVGDNDQESSLIGINLNTRYSGEYVRFGNENYRIVKVENNLTKLLKIDYIVDTGGTLVTKKFGTTNLYSQSLLDNTEYWGRYLNDESTGWYSTLSTADKNMIETGTWYSGMVGSGNSYKASICATVNPIAIGGTLTSNCEKTTATATAKIGLPRLGEMFTSRAPSNPESSLNMRIITPQTATNVYQIASNGSSGGSAISSLLVARPSLYLRSSVYITGGDGTPNNPFTIA